MKKSSKLIISTMLLTTLLSPLTVHAATDPYDYVSKFQNTDFELLMSNSHLSDLDNYTSLFADKKGSLSAVYSGHSNEINALEQIDISNYDSLKSSLSSGISVDSNSARQKFLDSMKSMNSSISSKVKNQETNYTTKDNTYSNKFTGKTSGSKSTSTSTTPKTSGSSATTSTKTSSTPSTSASTLQSTVKSTSLEELKSSIPKSSKIEEYDGKIDDIGNGINKVKDMMSQSVNSGNVKNVENPNQDKLKQNLSDLMTPSTILGNVVGK